LTAIDELCECVSPTMVHQLAAALGGRRLLRDRLAILGSDSPSTARSTDALLLQRLDNMFAEWCYERRRLGLRWLCPTPQWKANSKLDAIMKTARITGAERFAPPTEEPELVARPSLLSDVSPPKTAALRPSWLLQIQGSTTGNENLTNWLDEQSMFSRTPHVYQLSRRSPRTHKLAPLSAR